MALVFVACNGNREPVGSGTCGDGIAGPGEACDDGNRWFADGCTPDCTVEEGPFESEPNDTLQDATPWPGAPLIGRLVEGDVDCFTFDIGSCEAVYASLVGECPRDVVLSLFDETGSQLATGAVATDGCARIDPEVAPGARWILGTTAGVCVRTVLGTPVAGYTLDVETTSSEGLVAGEDDLDDDGTPDRCDLDLDGDGVDNVDDNCPFAPNGPNDVALLPNDEGFITTWLALAPIFDNPSPDGCLPSLVERQAGDAALAPAIGDADGDETWLPVLLDRNRFELLRFASGPAPREAYVHTYVVVDETRTINLAVGADDGVRAWLNGQVVLEVSSCQGTLPDEFQAAVTLLPGTNRLTFKVYDQGGGWGLFARFLDELGEPVTDYELSLSPDGGPLAPQSDIDGDGLGDLCDPTPGG